MSSQEPAPAEPAPAPEVQHTSVDVSAAPPETQPEQKPAATNAPTDEEARLPALNAMGSKSEVFVPMQGSLRGLRTTQWTDPLAIVLDLPDAHIDSPELLRGLRGGGVLRVRLDDSREVPRLQIFLNTVAARFATKLVPHGLLVVLEHDLQPLPQ